MVPTAKKWFLPPAERLLPPPNGSYCRRAVRTTRRTTPTTAERFLPPPSRPYRPPNGSYRCRTVRTAAESFVPSPNGSYQPPNDLYRRRAVRTNRRTISTAKILFPFVRTGDSSLDYGTALNEMGFGTEFSCVGCAENPRIFVRLRDAIRLKGAG